MDVENFVQIHPHPVVAIFHKNARRLPALQQVLRVGAVAALQKPAEGDGFQQIIEGIEGKTFQGIVGVGGRENNRFVERSDQLGKIRPAQVRHSNIQKNQINPLGVQEIQRISRIQKGLDQLQKRYFFGIPAQNLQGCGFVIDGNGSEHRWL